METEPTGEDYIAEELCVDRHAYLTSGRGIAAGIYIGQSKQGEFIGFHEHLGNYDLMRYFHYDRGAPLGTVQPLLDLGPIPTEFAALDLQKSAQSATEKETYMEFMVWLAKLELLSTQYGLKRWQELFDQALFENNDNLLDECADMCAALTESIYGHLELIALFERGETYNPDWDPRPLAWRRNTQ